MSGIKGINLGEKNGQWKGGEVGYEALHDWVKRHLERPKECKDCSKVKSLDLANISQEYKREITDWEWLCRRCHMIKDGRLKKRYELLAISREARRRKPMTCPWCKKSYIPTWSYSKHCSKSCSNKARSKRV